MSKMTKTAAYVISCLLSVVMFLVTFWSALFQNSSPYWVESLGMFLLTFLCLDFFTKKVENLNPWLLSLSIVLGQLIVHVPPRFIDFYGSLGSLMIGVVCIISIILATFCFKDKRPYSFIMTYVILSLFNTFVADMWDSYVLQIL